MATLVVIPARMAATRFPGKPLAAIGAKTLLQLVCERAAEIPGVAGIRVATDAQAIFDHVRGLGFDCAMTGAQHGSGTDRCAEAAGDWSGLLLNLQGDEPLFNVSAVARLIEKMDSEGGIEMGTAAVALAPGELEHPDRVKVLIDEENFAIDFHRLLPEPAPAGRALRHAGVYCYRADTLLRFVSAPPAEREIAAGLEQLRALALGISIWVEEAADWGPGVDRPEDLKTVAKLLGTG